MKLINSFLLFTFSFVIASFNGFAQQYNFRQYNVQEGLAHSHVSTIFQDDKGFIWLFTLGGGISKFDGKNFITYSEKNSLSSNLIGCAIKCKNGNFFFGTTGGGLMKYDGKKFERIMDNNSGMGDIIYSLAEDSDGGIWIGTSIGLYKYLDNKIIDINKQHKLLPIGVRGIFVDSKKKTWFGVWDKGVYCIERNELKHFSIGEGLTSPCYTITEDKKGSLWFGLKNGVVKAKDENGKLLFSSFDNKHLNNVMIYSILFDRKENIWFGTQEGGLIKYSIKENHSERITMKNGLSTNSVVSIMEDNEGNIWLSTKGYGVMKYSSSVFVHYTIKDGLVANYAGSIVQSNQEELLINSGSAISRLKMNDTIIPFSEKFPSKIQTIYKSKKGVLWIATEEGLYSSEKGVQKKYHEENGLKAFPPTSITEDSQGRIWLSSVFGIISCFDARLPDGQGKQFINYDKKDGLNGDYIYSIYGDSKGNVWICTWANGLCKYDGKQFKYFTKKDGLSSNNVMKIIEDEKGILWIGTYGGGINIFDPSATLSNSPTNFKIISTKQGLSDDVVVDFVFDQNKDLWISSTKGLSRLNIKEYDASGKIMFRVYGKTEGFTDIECNRNSAFKDENGNLWFGTKSGLTKYNPSEDRLNLIEPYTYITDIKLFFEDTDWFPFCDSINANTGLPSHLSLDYKNNHLTFNYIGISTTIPEKVRYRYMLEGVDKGWSPPTDKTSVTYSGLAHGSYKFKVMACNNEGVYNQNPTTFEFVITPPFWKRTWFYILCFIVIVGGFYIYVKFQTKKLARENKILEEKVEERTAEVVKKKDELEFAYHEIEEKNRDIMDSINYAKRIQYTILANEELLKENIPNHFILFQPKDIVSGDFYWATKKGSKFYLAVCDSTGHGVPGAFMSLLNISFLNEAISEKNILEPHEILNYVRERLITSVSKDGAQDGMDGILLCIDKDNNQITYAAALNAPVLVSDNKLIQLSADKMPIGKGERTNSFSLFNIEMKGTDVLYLYTDGYADQFGGASGKKFKYKQLHQLLISNSTFLLDEQNITYAKTINDWKGNLEQVDDILVIGIRI